MTAQTANPTNTLNISETVVPLVHIVSMISNELNISEVATRGQESLPPTNTLDISEIVTAGGELIQYDSWRSVPKFDNSLYVLCRTPLGEFDSYTGLTDMTLWTVDHDGLNEILRLDVPSTQGWTSYSHPEWSPDGQEITIAVETSTEYQLVKLDTSGWV